ncbi:MAG: hypothetical protein U0R26_10925 [Solirubrobacterales bacterium]
MRFIGMDVHRDHCQVAIAEAGKVRTAGRVPTRPKVLEGWPEASTETTRWC